MKKSKHVTDRKRQTRGARAATSRRLSVDRAAASKRLSTGRARSPERLPEGAGNQTHTAGLEGRVALVTGGGAGIGKAISLALGVAGASVVVNWRSRRAQAEIVASVIRSQGGKAMDVGADVSSPDGAAKAVEAAVREFGRLDILVNNVGDFLHKPLLEVTPEEWRATIQNNLDSAFYCSLQAVPHMEKSGWGRIVNLGVAGCDSIRAFPNTTAYNVAKTGVLILTKSLAKEVAPFGITVNLVAPGLIDTGALATRTKMKFEPSLPMGRAGTPDEVAGAVLFLVSEAASYITGACIPVSGGWLL